MKNEKINIHGGGNLGRLLVKAALRNGYEIHDWSDIQPNSKGGMVTPAKVRDKTLPTYIAIYNQTHPLADIYSDLASAGFSDIKTPLDYHEELWPELPKYWLSSDTGSCLNNPEVFEAIHARLIDSESRTTLEHIRDFRKNAYLRYSRHKSNTPIYANELTLSQRSSVNLLDVGASNGSATKQFYQTGSLRFAFCMEPQISMFTLLSGSLLNNKIPAIPLPLAAGCRATVAMTDGISTAFSLRDTWDTKPNGREIVTVAAIDEITQNGTTFRPDIIKMDVEGQEIAALKGAIKTIQNLKPTLCISAYHKPDDLFDIIDFVDSIKIPKYDIYLRQHGYNSFDSVLYFI